MHSKNQLCGKLTVVQLKWSGLMILNLENETSVKQQLDPLFLWSSQCLTNELIKILPATMQRKLIYNESDRRKRSMVVSHPRCTLSTPSNPIIIYNPFPIQPPSCSPHPFCIASPSHSIRMSTTTVYLAPNQVW